MLQHSSNHPTQPGDIKRVLPYHINPGSLRLSPSVWSLAFLMCGIVALKFGTCGFLTTRPTICVQTIALAIGVDWPQPLPWLLADALSSHSVFCALPAHQYLWGLPRCMPLLHTGKSSHVGIYHAGLAKLSCQIGIHPTQLATPS